jgi:hypothetical protein
VPGLTRRASTTWRTATSKLSTISRAQGVTIEASGSDGALIAFNLSAANDTDSYAIFCAGSAKAGRVVVPSEAFDIFPPTVTSLHLKLQAANTADGDDFTLLAAGASVVADLTLGD